MRFFVADEATPKQAGLVYQAFVKFNDALLHDHRTWILSWRLTESPRRARLAARSSRTMTPATTRFWLSLIAVDSIRCH